MVVSYYSKLAIVKTVAVGAALVSPFFSGCATPATYAKWTNRAPDTSSIGLMTDRAGPTSVCVNWRMPASDTPNAEGTICFDPEVGTCEQVEVFATRDGEEMKPDLSSWQALYVGRLADKVSLPDAWTLVESPACTVLLLVERTTERGRLLLRASTVKRSIGSWQVPPRNYAWLPLLPFAAALDVIGIGPLVCIVDVDCFFDVLNASVPGLHRSSRWRADRPY